MMSTLPHPADPKRERGLPKLSAKQDVPEDVDWSCHVDHKLQLSSIQQNMDAKEGMSNRTCGVVWS